MAPSPDIFQTPPETSQTKQDVASQWLQQRKEERRAERDRQAMTRRNFLGLAANFGMMVAGVGLGLKMTQEDKPSPETFPRVPLPEPLSAAAKAAPIPEPTKAPEIPGTDTLFNEIYNLSFDDPKRKELEQKYFDNAKTLDQIDKGFMCINYYKETIDPTKKPGDPERIKVDSNWLLKAKLLEKRYALRKEGKEGLKPIPEPLMEWARERQIHPEVIGIVLDSYADARKIVEKHFQKSKERFRPDLALRVPSILGKLTVDDIMPSIGAVAELICIETGLSFPRLKLDGTTELVRYGFINGGNKPSIEGLKYNTNTDAVKNEAALYRIAQFLSEKLKVKINPKKIPGSIAGAIAVQTMPKEAWELQEVCQQVGEQCTPLGPKSTVAAILKLAIGERVSDKDVRFGYLRRFINDGKDVFRMIREATFQKWNDHKEEVDALMAADDDYWNKIISKGKHPY